MACKCAGLAAELGKVGSAVAVLALDDERAIGKLGVIDATVGYLALLYRDVNTGRHGFMLVGSPENWL